MKNKIKSFPIFLIAAFIIQTFSACDNANQNQAMKDASQVQEMMKEIMPGAIATTKNGWTMQAKMDGKQWEANSIMPPEATARIMGHYKEEWISLPYSSEYLIEGKKIKFGDGQGVDIARNDEYGVWSGKTGEMEITKVGDEWVEGKFFFTVNPPNVSDKKIEVTDGFFRIAIK